MKVKGRHVEVSYVDVEIDPREVKHQLISMMKLAHGFRPSAYVNSTGEIVYEVEEYGGSHSWSKEVILNDSPTAEQIELFAVIDKFNEQFDLAVNLTKSVEGK